MKHYINKHCLLAIELVKKYTENSNAAVMHELRVSLKKIKTVITYLNETGQYSKAIKKTEKEIRIIFRVAGRIRDAELIMDWLGKSRYNLLLQEAAVTCQLHTNKELFIQKSKQYVKLLHSIHSKLKKSTNEEKYVLEYVTQLKQTVFAKKSFSQPGRWHELRKQIKQILYAVNWLHTKEKRKAVTVEKQKQLETIQELIGSWHDTENIKQWLAKHQSFFSKDDKLKRQFNRCRLQLQNEQQAKEKSISKLIKTRNKQ